VLSAKILIYHSKDHVKAMPRPGAGSPRAIHPTPFQLA
jgi:hypothetical protein